MELFVTYIATFSLTRVYALPVNVGNSVVGLMRAPVSSVYGVIFGKLPLRDHRPGPIEDVV